MRYLWQGSELWQQRLALQASYSPSMESKHPAHQDHGRRLQQATECLHLLYEGWEGLSLVAPPRDQTFGVFSEVREAAFFDSHAIQSK